MSNRERRVFVAQELRAAGTDKAPKIEGYAAVFNQRTDIGPFWEVIQPGAFSRTLASDDDVVCLFNHNEDFVLGRKSAGNLTLAEDDKGLKFSCLLPDTTVAKDTYANLRAGNLKECSFGFYISDGDGDKWANLPDGKMLRTLMSVRLQDVSVVTFPAYGGTSAAARNIVPEDIEQRMTRAMDSSNAGALIPSGGVVPFQKHDEKRDDLWDEEDAVNGIVKWASEDEADRSAGTKINPAKMAQGFAYVANDGTKRSDYLLPHHSVVDGKLAHHFTGSLRALGKLSFGKSGVPENRCAEVRQHLLNELGVFNDDADTNIESEIERSRLRLAVAKLSQ